MQAQPDSSLGPAGYLVASMCMQGWPDKLYLYISGFNVAAKMQVWLDSSLGPAVYWWLQCTCRAGQISFTCISVGSLCIPKMIILLGYGYLNWRHWFRRTFTFSQICSGFNVHKLYCLSKCRFSWIPHEVWPDI